MRKSDIRIRFKAMREALTDEEVAGLEQRMLERFHGFDAGHPATVHRYVPAPGRREPDPGPLLMELQRRHPDLRQIAPRLVPDSPTFRNLYLSPDTRWIDNAWGIPEPADGPEADPLAPDIVFVPLLAFDAAGHRVGYGKGYYDRFLAQCRSDCLRIGLCWFGPVDAIEDVLAHDIRLHFCITPHRIHAFS